MSPRNKTGAVNTNTPVLFLNRVPPQNSAAGSVPTGLASTSELAAKNDHPATGGKSLQQYVVLRFRPRRQVHEIEVFHQLSGGVKDDEGFAFARQGMGESTVACSRRLVFAGACTGPRTPVSNCLTNCCTCRTQHYHCPPAGTVLTYRRNTEKLLWVAYLGAYPACWEKVHHNNMPQRISKIR